MAAKDKTAPQHSPAMQQFFRAKEAHPDALLFFRMGDFYEMFYEDAVIGAELLDLTLTSRSKANDGNGIPMAGVPHHAAPTYIARLLEKGQKVAICEQMADPSKVKGLVPRDVVRVITPGLVLDTDALQARAHNYLAVAVQADDAWGLAALELSTSELRACRVADDAVLLAELVRLDAREVLLVGERDFAAVRTMIGKALPRASVRDAARLIEGNVDVAIDQVLGKDAAKDARKGLDEAAVVASAHALDYAVRTQRTVSLGVRRIARFDPRSSLFLDETAIRNLELVRTLSGERDGSLLAHIDCTKTSMGARSLRRRLLAPLTDPKAIAERHDLVQAFFERAALREEVRVALGRMPDMERLTTRTLMGVATPRDLAALRDALVATQELRKLLVSAKAGAVIKRSSPVDACEDVGDDLRAQLMDAPPLSSREGGVIRDGVDVRVDELRKLATSSRDVMLALEAKERENSGISGLRIGYTRVFGYYFEVTKRNVESVPSHFRRKQTVAGGERYTTEELDDLQAKIANADERLASLELELFEGLRARVGEHAHRLHALSQRIAEIDVACALADLAHRHAHVRPAVDDSLVIDLRDARHPVVETHLDAGQFVANDLRMDADGARMMIITGPNMAGKSTLMRQTALAVILAQMGAFVPASQARIGVVDRVFTRVGASDNLARGQSTFMVEMMEAAVILREATRHSLVVLDEIGRGTSTYDGLAIAWSVAEHLHDRVGCRTLFATHYHELCALALERDGIENWNVAAKEQGGDIVFLHRLAKGGASRSYGIAVAKLAGVPQDVIARAGSLLKALESESSSGAVEAPTKSKSRKPEQLAFAAVVEDPAASTILQRVRAIDVDRTTPLDALRLLAELREISRTSR